MSTLVPMDEEEIQRLRRDIREETKAEIAKQTAGLQASMQPYMTLVVRVIDADTAIPDDAAFGAKVRELLEAWSEEKKALRPAAELRQS
jgi:hypothetical protein